MPAPLDFAAFCDELTAALGDDVPLGDDPADLDSIELLLVVTVVDAMTADAVVPLEPPPLLTRRAAYEYYLSLVGRGAPDPPADLIPDAAGMLAVDDLAVLLTEILPGRDWPALEPATSLEAVGVDEVSKLLLWARLEARGGFELPVELCESIETVDDVLYFFNVRREHVR